MSSFLGYVMGMMGLSDDPKHRIRVSRREGLLAGCGARKVGGRFGWNAMVFLDASFDDVGSEADETTRRKEARDLILYNKSWWSIIVGCDWVEVGTKVVCYLLRLRIRYRVQERGELKRASSQQSEARPK